MDSKDSRFYWESFVDHIFKDDENRANLKHDLETCINTGGVNLGLSFLESLRVRSCTFSEFKRSTVQHNSLYNYLCKEFPDDHYKFGSLTNTELEGIARHLNGDTSGVLNWENYAKKFNYTECDIMSIRNAGKNSSSPSRCLLKTKLPENFTLYEMRQAMIIGSEGNRLTQCIDNITRKILQNP